MKEKKALLVRLSSLGDVIFNIPLANVLKNNGYKVTWVVGEKGVDVVKNNPAVDETIFIPWKKWKKQGFLLSFIEYVKIIKYLRSQKFDIAIDTHGLWKSFIWMLPCGAERKIVSETGKEFSRFGGKEKIKNLHDKNTHAIYNYLKFAKHLNLATEEINITLPPSSRKNSSKIKKLLAKIPKDKPVIAFAPATTWTSKHWDIQNWKELAFRLSKNYTIIFTGTKHEIPLIEEIRENKYHSIAGETNILELAEFYRNCNLLISVDSGSTHLAWACQNIKIITIFCSTSPKRYAPLGTKNKYIAHSANLDCQYCHKRICSKKINKYGCTKLPSVDEIETSVKILLNESFINR